MAEKRALKAKRLANAPVRGTPASNKLQSSPQSNLAEAEESFEAQQTPEVIPDSPSEDLEAIPQGISADHKESRKGGFFPSSAPLALTADMDRPRAENVSAAKTVAPSPNSEPSRKRKRKSHESDEGPHRKLRRDTFTVTRLWQEWKHGVDGAAPLEGEYRLGSDTRFFTKRKVILDAITVEDDTEGAVARLEKQRKSNKWSIPRLSKEISDTKEPEG